MPIYEYACKSCGEHHEVSQSFTDEALTICPACGGPLRKVFGSIGIAFKGSGFYRTDARSGGAKANGKGEKDERPEKSEKGEKAEKPEKSEKGEAEKSGKSTADKGGAGKGTTPKADKGSSSAADSAKAKSA